MKITPMSVDLIDRMGTDLTVVNAARVSFAKESQFVRTDVPNPAAGSEHCMSTTYSLSEADAKLINYLAKHNHWTPFGHCFLQFRIKAPIFVARQLVKHQVGLVWNEVSRRYVDDEPEFWLPKSIRSRPEGSVKQGSGGEHYCSAGWIGSFKTTCMHAVKDYNEAIKDGVAPEQARMILPQNMQTEWYWSGSLAAFARVCKLRLDPHAQAETRVIAEQIARYAAQMFPVSWEALSE